MANKNDNENNGTNGESIMDQLEQDEQQLSRLNMQLGKLTDMLERVRFQEYMDHLNDPKRMLYKNFINGVSRGLGMAVGFTVLGAILIQLLTALANNNIPVISKIIAEIIKTVEHYL